MAVVAVFAALASALFTLADSPSAVPRAVSTANDSATANVTSAFAVALSVKPAIVNTNGAFASDSSEVL